ncbi:protein yippee-like 5 isoform X1 [Thunnus thynnus]|uniref:protein yippee-like 5 isoform X1 n=1 Tax=Thunnus thynnus TaxID=8237 RepID=UPI0035279199
MPVLIYFESTLAEDAVLLVASLTETNAIVTGSINGPPPPQAEFDNNNRGRVLSTEINDISVNKDASTREISVSYSTNKSATGYSHLLLNKMGRIFLDHIGGTRLFSCANCDTILTNRAELISTRFTGATGRAFLFNKVVNLQHSEVQDRVMLTGRHMVRDVSCKNCNSKLGWMYEFATEESQRYKEGRVILERALVRESEGFEHVPSDNS